MIEFSLKGFNNSSKLHGWLIYSVRDLWNIDSRLYGYLIIRVNHWIKALGVISPVATQSQGRVWVDIHQLKNGLLLHVNMPTILGLDAIVLTIEQFYIP